MKAALVAIGIPLFALFWGSALLFAKEKSMWSFLHVIGTRCLVIVVLTHICEALGLFPWMHLGLKGSVGHYLDFWSATLGLTLFPVGYLFHSPRNRHVWRQRRRSRHNGQTHIRASAEIEVTAARVFPSRELMTNK